MLTCHDPNPTNGILRPLFIVMNLVLLFPSITILLIFVDYCKILPQSGIEKSWLENDQQIFA